MDLEREACSEVIPWLQGGQFRTPHPFLCSGLWAEALLMQRGEFLSLMVLETERETVV